MKYLLDTNICIHFFRGKFNLIQKFEEVGIKNCAISEITLAELIYGAESSNNPKKNHLLIEKFTEKITIYSISDSIYKYGNQKAKLRKKGKMISDFDLLIGCTAIEHKMIMITENVNEFERIEDIKIENWIQRN